MIRLNFSFRSLKKILSESFHDYHLVLSKYFLNCFYQINNNGSGFAAINLYGTIQSVFLLFSFLVRLAVKLHLGGSGVDCHVIHLIPHISCVFLIERMIHSLWKELHQGVYSGLK